MRVGRPRNKQGIATIRILTVFRLAATREPEREKLREMVAAAAPRGGGEGRRVADICYVVVVLQELSRSRARA